MNFRGKEAYKTRCGAIMSIFTIVILVSYMGLRIDKLINHKNPDVVANEILRDMSTLDPLNSVEERF